MLRIDHFRGMTGTSVATAEILNDLGSLGVAVPDEATTAYGDLGRELNLNAVAVGLGLGAVEYESERFPGLAYAPDAFDGDVAVLFGNGVVFVATATTDPRDAIAGVGDRLVDLGLIDEGAAQSVDVETFPGAVPVPAEYGDASEHEEPTGREEPVERGTSASTGTEPRTAPETCDNCGHELSGGETFCPACGVEL